VETATLRAARFSLPWALLAIGIAISGVLVIAWRTHLTFFIDDWDLLLHRRGFSTDVFLDPHARHLIVGPTALWKAIQATFGMDSQLPYAIASTTCFLASVVLLFVYLRARVGDWLALAGVLPLLFMGTAYEDLLNVFQICYFGSMALGLGALLAFERGERRGDVLACLLLIGSLAFAEIAFAFAAACAVLVALDRGPWRRLWVVVVPAVAYLLWYTGWGESGPSSLSFDNVATSPAYVLDGFASSLASLFGIGTPILLGGNGGLDWGRSLLVALGAVAVWGLVGHPQARSRVLIPLAAGLAFWLLTAANAGLGRPPDASRYQYVGAVFLLMMAADYVAGQLPGWRPDWRSWRVLVPVFFVAALATGANLSTLHDSYNAYRTATAIVRSDLAALEISRDQADPGFVLTPENSGFEYFGYVVAGPYLSAADKFGSPAYSEAQLAGAPESARVAADKVFAAALGLRLEPLSTLPPAGATAPQLLGPSGALAGESPGCVTVQPIATGPPVLTLPPGGAMLEAAPGVRAELGLRRFASAAFPVHVATLRGAGRLDIPRDNSGRPWELQVSATGKVTVCGQ
jgi:hypothetical protein